MSYNRRALYNKATAREQERLRKEWAKTGVGSLIDDVRRNALRPQSMSPLTLESLFSKLMRGQRNTSLASLANTSLSALLGDAVRYSKRGAQAQRLVKQILDLLGPVGKMLASIVRSAGAPVPSYKNDLDAATNLLRGFGNEVLPSPAAQAAQTPEDFNRSLLAAREFLERNGFEVRPGANPTPGAGYPTTPTARPVLPAKGVPKPHEPGGAQDRPAPGNPPAPSDGKVIIDLGGERRKFPANHPIVTKGKVSDFSSSNVLWYLYDVDTRTLYVRYKHDGGPGPIYGYSHVPPKVFLAMLAAPSKGTFIWDAIRIRGTVSGHQYDYRLVAVRGGYVPRKATMTATGEWYVRREVVTSNRKGERKVQRSRETAPVPAAHSRYPGYGDPPDRGRPNRGGPNRGR